MITPDIIKQCLLADGYADSQATNDTVLRLLSLKGKARVMLKEWVELGKEPQFESINGVDSCFLRQRLKMKSAALILAYAMLLDAPIENADYFKHLSNNIIGFYPSKL